VTVVDSGRPLVCLTSRKDEHVEHDADGERDHGRQQRAETHGSATTFDTALPSIQTFAFPNKRASSVCSPAQSVRPCAVEQRLQVARLDLRRVRLDRRCVGSRGGERAGRGRG
jgi:hypothetical protein